MQRVWSWLGLNLGKRAGTVAAVAVVLTAVFGFGITKLNFATGQDSYLNKSDTVYTDSVDYQNLFGGQAMLTLVPMDKGTSVADLLTGREPAHDLQPFRPDRFRALVRRGHGRTSETRSRGRR